jgi:hypothetical protein
MGASANNARSSTHPHGPVIETHVHLRSLHSASVATRASRQERTCTFVPHMGSGCTKRLPSCITWEEPTQPRPELVPPGLPGVSVP